MLHDVAHRLAIAAALAVASVALAGCGSNSHGHPHSIFLRTEIFNDSRHAAFYEMYVWDADAVTGSEGKDAYLTGTIYPDTNESRLARTPSFTVKHFYVMVWPTNAGGSSGMVLNETIPFDAVACAGVDPVVLSARLTQEPASPVVHVHASLNCPAWQKDADSPPSATLPGSRE